MLFIHKFVEVLIGNTQEKASTKASRSRLSCLVIRQIKIAVGLRECF